MHYSTLQFRTTMSSFCVEFHTSPCLRANLANNWHVWLQYRLYEYFTRLLMIISISYLQMATIFQFLLFILTNFR